MVKHFIIDFDSTFVKSEGLEKLAEVALRDQPDRSRAIQSIKKITTLGMEGKISFNESLRRRLLLLKGHRVHVEEVIRILKKKISRSVIRNRAFFKKFKNNIYIVSGGFKEYIDPIVSEFGIATSHVFANRFVYDHRGVISGYEKNNPLAEAGGKVRVVKDLNLDGEIFVIGDGYTDYQVKEMGVAKKFVAFTENVVREAVVEKADHVAPNFDEFLYVNRLPRSLSYPRNRISVLAIGNTDSAALRFFNVVKVDSQIDVIKKIWSDEPRLIAIGLFNGTIGEKNLSDAMERGIAIFTDAPSIARYINTGSTAGCMNIPHVSVPKTKNTHRLLHIHRNVPGMLAKINGVMARHNLNILMQFLKTNKTVGYLVTDVNKKYDANVLKDLKKISQTIRFRVLY